MSATIDTYSNLGQSWKRKKAQPFEEQRYGDEHDKKNCFGCDILTSV
jgi:hypothetical protein